MESQKFQFNFIDYIIFAATIAGSIAIGLFHALSGGRQRTTSEFLVADRKMSILPVAVSMMVSFESAIMILGVPAEIYVYGIQWIISNIAYCLANLFMIPLVVPLIHRLKITSTYEYLELRFNSHGLRIIGTVLGILSDLCYMGVVLFGPAIALEAVTGFPQWASIVAIAVAATMYTALGGIKAVIWTDVFQCLLMFAGFLAVLIKGTMQSGGVEKTWSIAEDKGRLNFLNFDPDPTVRHTFWCLFFGDFVRGTGLLFRQTSVQRISSTPTQKSAKIVSFLFVPGFFLSMSLAAVAGLVTYSYYDTKRCDPIEAGQIDNPNQIIPFMILDIFSSLHGMPGLFMASLFSATLSTLSSGFSSMSALFWEDLVKPHVRPMSERKATLVAKSAVVLFGGLTVLLAYLSSLVGGTLNQIGSSLIAAFGGPLTGVFLLGVFCPWATAKGTIAGSVVSVLFTFALSLGQMTTPGAVKNQKLTPAPTDMCQLPNNTALDVINVTSFLLQTTANPLATTLASQAAIAEPTGARRLFMLSYQWFNATGILITMLIATFISLATGGNKRGEVNSSYTVPLFDTLCCCLPDEVKRVLRCGMQYNKDTKEDQEKAVIELEDPSNIGYPVDKNGIKSGKKDPEDTFTHM